MYYQTVRMILLILGFVAYSRAVPVVTAGSSLKASALTLQVSFLDYDKTAQTAGIHGVNKQADDLAQGWIKAFFNHPQVRHKLGFSKVPTFRFLNSFPYKTVAADSGVHINFVGGSICGGSRCALILGKTTNPEGKTGPYGVVYNAQGSVIYRVGSDVAIVSFEQPTQPETFSGTVDGIAKSTIKRFFEHPQVAKELKLSTPVVSFEGAYTYTTIKMGGAISFFLHSGAGCTLSLPCRGQAGIAGEPSLSVFSGKVENSHGQILVQIREPIHGR